MDFYEILTSFNKNLRALRAFVNCVKPAIDNRQEEIFKTHGVLLAPLFLGYSKISDCPDRLTEADETILRDAIKNIYGDNLTLEIIESENEPPKFEITAKGDASEKFRKAECEFQEGNILKKFAGNWGR